MDSTLCILKASNINPTCDIVLKAYNLFSLDCVKPTIVPIIKDKIELNNKLIVQEKFTSNIDLFV